MAERLIILQVLRRQPLALLDRRPQLRELELRQVLDIDADRDVGFHRVGDRLDVQRNIDASPPARSATPEAIAWRARREIELAGEALR